MNDTFAKTALIAPALLMAAFAVSIHTSSDPAETIAAKEGSNAAIVVAGNTPRKIYKPRLSYKQAKELGFIK